MGERLTLPEMVARISAKKSLDKTKVEQFMSALFETIQEQLITARVAKVRGLGVFKLEWFASRVIANVNTGEESTIGGHYRIVFTPEKEVATLVNSNFAHFQTIVLGEEGDEREGVEPEETVNVAHSSSGVTSHRAPINDILSELVEARTIIREIEQMDEPEDVAELDKTVQEAVPVKENELLADAETTIEPAEDIYGIDDVIQSMASEETNASVTNEPTSPAVEVNNGVGDEAEDDDILPIPEANNDAEGELAAEDAEEQAINYSISVEPINDTSVKEEEKTNVVEQPEHRAPRKGKGAWSVVVTGVAIIAVLGIFGYIYLEYFGVTERLQTETVMSEEKPSLLNRTISWFKRLTTSNEQDEMIVPTPSPLGSGADETGAEDSVANGGEQTTSPSAAEQQKALATETKGTAKRIRVDGVYDKLLFGETLQSMATKHYERSEFWCYIYEENKSKIKNIFQIKSGTKLVIPTRTKYNINPNDSASVQIARIKSAEIMKLMRAK